MISYADMAPIELQVQECRCAQLPGNKGSPDPEQIESLHAFKGNHWMLMTVLCPLHCDDTAKVSKVLLGGVHVVISPPHTHTGLGTKTVKGSSRDGSL